MWTPSDEVKLWLREKYSYDPLTGIITITALGKECGHPHRAGYLQVTITNVKLGLKRSVLAHRLAWLLHHGEWPEVLIDHQNHILDDNRIENIRLATELENTWNRLKPRGYANKTCSSEFKGVSWNKRIHKWMAYIRINKRLVHLGYFACELEAAQAYTVATRTHFREFAHVSELDTPLIV